MWNIKTIIIAIILSIIAGFGAGRISAPKVQKIDMTQYVTRAEYERVLAEKEKIVASIAKRRWHSGKKPEVISNPERLVMPKLQK